MGKHVLRCFHRLPAAFPLTTEPLFALPTHSFDQIVFPLLSLVAKISLISSPTLAATHAVGRHPRSSAVPLHLRPVPTILDPFPPLLPSFPPRPTSSLWQTCAARHHVAVDDDNEQVELAACCLRTPPFPLHRREHIACSLLRSSPSLRP
jgi:hypothetical protein